MLQSYEMSNETATWNTQKVHLRYSLSYLKLFEWGFRALVDPSPFDPQRPMVSGVEPPVTEVPTGYDAVVQRHQPLSGNIAVIQRLPGLLCYAPRQLLHFYTDLTGGPEQAFSTMSSKTRSTVLRKVRRYKEFCASEIRWAAYQSPNEMLHFHELAREVARKTYQERLFDSGIPNTEAFRTYMLELARRDSVRGFVLFHGDRPIAYLYTPAPDGYLVYDYLGYDPEYADHSPGTVLQYLALEALYAERRFPLYYWGYGYSQTKHIFSSGQMLAADIYYFRPTLRNWFAVRLHYSIDRFSEGMGSLLNRFSLKQTIKRYLKRQ